MIFKVPIKDIHIVWNQVEPLIKKALDDCYTADDILKGLINIKNSLLMRHKMLIHFKKLKVTKIKPSKFK